MWEAFVGQSSTSPSSKLKSTKFESLSPSTKPKKAKVEIRRRRSLRLTTRMQTPPTEGDALKTKTDKKEMVEEIALEIETSGALDADSKDPNELEEISIEST